MYNNDITEQIFLERFPVCFENDNNGKLLNNNLNNIFELRDPTSVDVQITTEDFLLQPFSLLKPVMVSTQASIVYIYHIQHMIFRKYMMCLSVNSTLHESYTYCTDGFMAPWILEFSALLSMMISNFLHPQSRACIFRVDFFSLHQRKKMGLLREPLFLYSHIFILLIIFHLAFSSLRE